MFKKPPTVKNLSVLRSSDRKKVLHQIVHDFGLDSLSQDAKNSLLPDGAQVSLQSTLVPEMTTNICSIHRPQNS
jgi:Pre-PUA-like domain